MSLLATYLEQGLTPDIIDETDPNDVYLGYFKYNSATAPNHCAIKRVTKATIEGEIITKIRFPFGQFDFKYDFDGRAAFEYRYKDFPTA